MSVGELLELRVEEAQALTPLVRMLRLRALDGRPLPAWTAGAHLQVRVPLPAADAWRHYSLIDLPGVTSVDGAGSAPREYVIAVRRDDSGGGGSVWMHRLQPGEAVTVQAPKNDFPLASAPRAVLLAGGIGITPLASMAAQARREGRAVHLHYAGRSREQMALLPALQALLGDELQVHADDEQQGRALDVSTVLEGCGPQDVLHVCGPKPMLDAVLAEATRRGWAKDRLRFELFNAPVPEAGDRAFEVVLARSGKTITVGPKQTLLAALIDAGCDPMFDCERGECGVCAVDVIDGEIDHRDVVLTQREKDAGNVMQACVSRCKGPRLVLDL